MKRSRIPADCLFQNIAPDWFCVSRLPQLGAFWHRRPIRSIPTSCARLSIDARSLNARLIGSLLCWAGILLGASSDGFDRRQTQFEGAG